MIHRKKRFSKMLKKKIYRVRINTRLALEHLRTVLVKIKIVLYLLVFGVCCVLAYLLIKGNWHMVTKIYKNSTLVGVIGTLLGAIIGGVFTLIGSLCVGKQQIKAQNQIRRKNIIYKPLYDELFEIHNSILKENPYPLYIDFQKGSQTWLKHPQFVIWGSIKLDSRYLETPSKIARIMDRLEENVKKYLEQRLSINKVVTKILNDILLREIEVTCTVCNIGDHLLRQVLSDSTFDLFDELGDSLTPRKSVDEERRQRVQE